MDQYRVDSEFNKVRLFVFGIGSIWFFAIAAYLLFLLFTENHFSFTALLILLPLLFSLWCFRKVVASEKLLIENDVLKIKSIFGRVKRSIPLSEMQAYGEVDRKNKGMSWKELTLFAIPDNYVVSSSLYNNYGLIKEIVIEGKPDHTSAMDRMLEDERKREGVFVALFGLAFVLGALIYWFANQPTPISAEDLITKQFTLKRDLNFRDREVSLPKLSPEFPLMKFVEIPQHLFKLDTRSLREGVQKIDVRVPKGETLEVELLEKDYQRIVEATPNGEVGKKEIIYVYGIRLPENQFLTIDDFKEQKHSRENLWLMILVLFFGLVFLIAGLAQWRKG